MTKPIVTAKSQIDDYRKLLEFSFDNWIKGNIEFGNMLFLKAREIKRNSAIDASVFYEEIGDALKGYNKEDQSIISNQIDKCKSDNLK